MKLFAQRSLGTGTDGNTKRDTMSTSCSANGESGLAADRRGRKELRKNGGGGNLLVGSKSWTGPHYSLIAPEKGMLEDNH